MADIPELSQLDSTKRIDVSAKGGNALEILDTSQKHIVQAKVEANKLPNGGRNVQICTSDGQTAILDLKIEPTSSGMLGTITKSATGEIVAYINKTQILTHVTDHSNHAFFTIRPKPGEENSSNIFYPNSKQAAQLSRYKAYSTTMMSSLNLASISTKPFWKAILMCAAIMQEMFLSKMLW